MSSYETFANRMKILFDALEGIDQSEARDMCTNCIVELLLR